MISETDRICLETYYPALKANEEGTEVTGQLVFTAAYDKTANLFTPLTLPEQTAPGVIISDTYDVIIKPGKDDKSLPALKVLGGKVPINTDRHFYTNETACVCGPIEEVEFFKTDFSFARYLEKLAIPFFYAQSYYDLHKEWPWGEYAHNAAGIFQSYYSFGTTVEHTEACLRKLQADPTWNRIQAVLSGQERVTETSKCFCSKHSQMRNCAASVWYGILKLKRDLGDRGISLGA